MIQTITSWFEALSAREKIMIGVLGALVAATVIFYGIYRPVSSAMVEAEREYREAVERAVKIEGKVAALSDPAGDQQNQQSGPISDYVSNSAGQAGFAIGRLDPQTDGSVQLTVASAKSGALFGWLSKLEMRDIAVERLTVDTAANGTVTANLTLRKSRPPSGQ